MTLVTQTHTGILNSFLAAAVFTSALEGCAFGAVAGLGTCIAAAAHTDAVEGAVILAVCVVGAGLDAALNAVVNLFHFCIPPFVGYGYSMVVRTGFILLFPKEKCSGKGVYRNMSGIFDGFTDKIAKNGLC